MLYDWVLQSAAIISHVPGNIKYFSGSSGKGRGSRCQGRKSNLFTGWGIGGKPNVSKVDPKENSD